MANNSYVKISICHWLVGIGVILLGLLLYIFYNYTRKTSLEMKWLTEVPSMLVPVFAIIAYKVSISYEMRSVISYVLLAISCG